MHGNQYFPTDLQLFQYYDKYSRFSHELNRRESWHETVARTAAFLNELSDYRLPEKTYNEIQDGILNLAVMPSMRTLAMAGPAARRDNSAIYNCAAIAIESLDAFHETAQLAMNGVGVGYSVERQFTDNLPDIKYQRGNKQNDLHLVGDSTAGWSFAIQYGIARWFNGFDVDYDFSQVRPEGAILYTKGGRASGPEPLRQMLAYIRAKILSRQGLKLRPIDIHDIMCAIAQGTICGGVRRTSLLALFDPDDQEMLHAKDGDFDPLRYNANNSEAFSDRITRAVFDEYFDTLINSGRGEPGIFNRFAAIASRPSRRNAAIFLVNPCGETVLLYVPNGGHFCNLSSAVARPNDTLESLKHKVELATIIGTVQSLGTYFPNLRPAWKAACEQERLIGVDINGIMDCPVLQSSKALSELRDFSVMTNKRWAEYFGINQAAACTLVKPSGNSSTMLGCSSGIHPRWSDYYIRNVRINTTSPIYKLMRASNAPMHPENGQTPDTATTWVIHFPVKSPDGSITRHDLSAIDQCENWLRVKENYAEHSVSATITYKPCEAEPLREWVWDHLDRINGLTFLPFSNAKYEQMPYQEIDKATYERLAETFPAIDYSRLPEFEQSDQTTGAKELACSSGICEFV